MLNFLSNKSLFWYNRDACYEREENDDVISNQRSEFPEKAQKNEVIYGEECSCMGSGDSDRVTGGICAGVLCGNESDYGGKFYGVYRIRWQSDTGKPVYL